MKRQLIPEDIDCIISLIEQIADAVLKSGTGNLRDKDVKVLQRELDLHLFPLWAGLLQCSSWGFQGEELRKAIEYYFLGKPAGYRLFPPEKTLPSAKSKVIHELELIKAKLEYDMQRLMSSKADAGKRKRGRKKSPQIATRNKEIRTFRAKNPKLTWEKVGREFDVSAGTARKACDTADN